jgi:hypothetical protein
VQAVEREAARTSGKQDEAARLEAEVRAQEATVEKVANTLLEVGVSDHLRARLQREESKLRDLRRALASAPKAKPKVRRLSLETILAEVLSVTAAAVLSPPKARDALAGLIEPVLMRPTDDGYEAEIQPKTTTATRVGGRQSLNCEVAGAGFEPATFGL